MDCIAIPVIHVLDRVPVVPLWIIVMERGSGSQNLIDVVVNARPCSLRGGDCMASGYHGAIMVVLYDRSNIKQQEAVQSDQKVVD